MRKTTRNLRELHKITQVDQERGNPLRAARKLLHLRFSEVCTQGSFMQHNLRVLHKNVLREKLHVNFRDLHTSRIFIKIVENV